MISERALKQWRRDALKDMINPKVLATNDGVDHGFHIDEVRTLSERILRLTQELMDLHLIRK
jgi:hypothetical protein